MQIILQTDENCNCSESVGLRIHNCKYRRLRDSLIPQAADFADSQLPADQQGTRSWNRIFTAEIVQLLAQQEASDGGDHDLSRNV
jgi:hypothetical protein